MSSIVHDDPKGEGKLVLSDTQLGHQTLTYHHPNVLDAYFSSLSGVYRIPIAGIDIASFDEKNNELISLKNKSLVRFSTVNTNNTEQLNEDKTSFADIYAYLGVHVDKIDKINECCTKAYAVDCIRCGTKFYSPISCHDRYLCERCRSRVNRRQRKEISEVLINIYEGVKDIRVLQYGKRFKFIFQTFTLPKELSIRINYDNSLINRFTKVIRKSLNKYYGGQIGGVMIYHEWSTRKIWEDHFHFHVIYPNIIRGAKKYGQCGFGVIPHYLSKEELDRFRRIYTDELNKEFDLKIDMAEFDHKYARNFKHFFHELRYMCRNVFDDFERGFIGLKKSIKMPLNGGGLIKEGWFVWVNEYKGDKDYCYVVPVSVMERILNFQTDKYHKRVRWFGFLGDSVKTNSLKFLNVFRERICVKSECPLCGGELVLNRDEIYTAWDKDREIKWHRNIGKWKYWVEVVVG